MIPGRIESTKCATCGALIAAGAPCPVCGARDTSNASNAIVARPVQRASFAKRSVGLLVLTPMLLFIFLFVSPRACSTFFDDGLRDAVKTVASCDRARALLGDDIHPAWVGCTTGSSASNFGAGGGARWTTRISGSNASGWLDWSASKEERGWTTVGAHLSAGGQDIDIIECTTHGAKQSTDLEIESD
jgi:hypothetical protein